MNTTDQKIGVWCGISFTGLFGIAMLLAGFIPPPGPGLDPLQVAAIYQGNAGPIRLGMLIGLMGCAMMPAFAAAISAQMLRMQGISRMTVLLQVSAGAAGAVVLMVPVMLFAIASFRPERDPALTALVHDAAWLFFIAPFSMAFIQNMAIAMGTLLDRGAQPVFPRWIGFFNIWIALLFLPGGLAFFLKSGPFAWNGLLSFWVAAGAFFVWFIVMAIYMFKAIAQTPQKA